MSFRIAALACGALLLVPGIAPAQPACGPGHLVTIGPTGSVLAGSKEALRRAAADGQALRVGWALDSNGDGVPEIAQWADAGLISEVEGEVFAQVDAVQRQPPVAAGRRIDLPAGRQRWSAVLGSNGTLVGHVDDGSASTSTPVRSTWCVDPRAVSCAPQWRLQYRHDADGRPLEGDTQALLDAVRRGAPLRVAWGFSADTAGGPVSVEHTADPVFVTIMEGTHVVVQLPEHIAQTSYHRSAAARFDRPSVMWRGLMSTDGTFDAVMVDRATGAEVRRLPQRAGLAWFAQLPPPVCAAQPPLTLAVPGGARAVRPAP